MDFLRPSTWDEALRLRAGHPDALPVHGGTDVMVDLNFDRRRPTALLDLTSIPELATWSVSDGGTAGRGGVVRLGAGVPSPKKCVGESDVDQPMAPAAIAVRTRSPMRARSSAFAARSTAARPITW